MGTGRSRKSMLLLAVIVVAIIGWQIYKSLINQGIIDPAMNPGQKFMQNREKSSRQKSVDELIQKLGSNGKLGNANAPVKVVTYIGIGIGQNHQIITDLINYVNQHPQDVHLQVIDLRSKDAILQAAKAGIIITSQNRLVKRTILVNGKSQFTLMGAGGKARSISLEQQGMVPGESTPPSVDYTSKDVLDIVQQELAKSKQ
jgi:hypothetical protein